MGQQLILASKLKIFCLGVYNLNINQLAKVDPKPSDLILNRLMLDNNWGPNSCMLQNTGMIWD